MWYNNPNSKPVSAADLKDHTDSRFFRLPNIMNSIQKYPELEIQQKKSLSSLAEYASVLHTIADIDQFVKFSLDTLLSLVNATSGSFFLWDDFNKVLISKSASGSRCEQIHEIKIKLREGITGWVADKGCPVLVQDITSDERFRDLRRPSDQRYQSYSFLSLPLIAHNRLVGIINITEKEQQLPFDEHDLDAAKALAAHVAIAYENLRIQKELKKNSETINMRNRELQDTIDSQSNLVSIGKLASHLAHDLGNPIDGIRRYVNLALGQLKDERDAVARDYLLRSKKGIKQLIRVIRGLLTYARDTHKSKSSEGELHGLIEECLSLLHQESNLKGIKIKKQFCGVPIYYDESGLRTVFQNLLQNAFDAMSQNGSLTISTAVEGKQVIIQFQDSGEGIPENIRDRIFDPFFSTKTNREGTGIGLPICKEIVERLGGQIAYESQVGGGTKFIVLIPYRNEGEVKSHG